MFVNKIIVMLPFGSMSHQRITYIGYRRRRYHSMDDDETELIQAIREQIHDTHDEAVKVYFSVP